jgi:hypothetical protein
LEDFALEWVLATVEADRVLSVTGLRDGGSPWLVHYERSGPERRAVLRIGPPRSQEAAAGYVVGALQYVGGPPVVINGRARSRPPVSVVGAITAKALTTGHTYESGTNRTGRFTFRVPAGRYKITGGPNGQRVWCFADVAVTVRAGRATRVDVICSVP